MALGSAGGSDGATDRSLSSFPAPVLAPEPTTALGGPSECEPFPPPPFGAADDDALSRSAEAPSWAEAALSRLGGELAELRQRHADALSTVQRQARLLERELVAEEEGERGCSSGVAKGKAGMAAVADVAIWQRCDL